MLSEPKEKGLYARSNMITAVATPVRNAFVDFVLGCPMYVADERGQKRGGRTVFTVLKDP
jgi:hypothetical protein